MSDRALVFSNSNATVKRPGGASCYPAAFAELPADRCMCVVVLDACPRGNNWMSFGLCKSGFESTSSDGVGRSSNSWGICDNRDRTTVDLTHVASNGQLVTRCRKLVIGDRLSCLVDVSEGFCEVALNTSEFVYRFEIPKMTKKQLYFVATMANDHQVSLV